MDDVTIPKRTDLNPADAMLLAGDLFRAWKFYEAGQLFRAVLEAQPDNFHAAHALGVSLLEQNRCADALPVLERAAGMIRAELMAVANNRGRALLDLGRAEEALAAFDTVLRAAPNDLIARYNRGLCHLQMVRCQEAITDFDRVLASAPDDGKARFGRGFANLVLGNYADGFRDYESRLKEAIAEPKVQLWDGSQDVAGKTILVYGEQGLGDNIMFARYLPMLVERGATVLLSTPAAVAPVLAHLPGVTIVAEEQERWPPFDMWVRCMSLAWCFRTTAQTVPPPVPLQFENERLAKWRTRLGERVKLKVGLVWSGNPESRYDAHRSMLLHDLMPVIEVPGVMFYSLQLGVRERDKQVLRGLQAANLIDLSAHLTDFRETAHALKCLDLMITVDTSVAHMAGTVGVPTWVALTTFRTYWLWITQLETSPWYPSARIFRQPRDGDWEAVAMCLRRELEKMRR